jgi:dihydroorotase-like cyclic amidohydrolase
MKDGTMTRRAFVRKLGRLSVAAPLVSMIGCEEDDSSGKDTNDSGKVDAFKLSQRGRPSCNACREHARYKLFASAAIADTHRAHAGCNCAIKLVRISKEDAQRYFAEFPYYDRRTGT